MNWKIQLYDETGELIYVGHLQDEETQKLTHNKRFNLEYSSGILFIYLIGNKEN